MSVKLFDKSSPNEQSILSEAEFKQLLEGASSLVAQGDDIILTTADGQELVIPQGNQLTDVKTLISESQLSFDFAVDNFSANNEDGLESNSVVISSIKGAAYVITSDGRREVSEGDSIATDTVIFTESENSEIEIVDSQTNNKATIILDTDTEISLQQSTVDSLIVGLNKGTIANTASESFSISTPVGVITLKINRLVSVSTI